MTNQQIITQIGALVSKINQTNPIPPDQQAAAQALNGIAKLLAPQPVAPHPPQPPKPPITKPQGYNLRRDGVNPKPIPSFDEFQKAKETQPIKPQPAVTDKNVKMERTMTNARAAFKGRNKK